MPELVAQILLITSSLVFIGLGILAVLLIAIFVVWFIQILIEAIQNKEEN